MSLWTAISNTTCNTNRLFLYLLFWYFTKLIKLDRHACHINQKNTFCCLKIQISYSLAALCHDKHYSEVSTATYLRGIAKVLGTKYATTKLKTIYVNLVFNIYVITVDAPPEF